MRGEVIELCRKTYQEYVLTADIPNDLRNALKAHERVPVFIDNLAKEISYISNGPALFKLGNKRITRDEIISITRDFTKVFIQNVHRQAEEKMMSDAAKKAIAENAARAAIEEKLIEETLTDESTERTEKGVTTRSTYEIS